MANDNPSTLNVKLPNVKLAHSEAETHDKDRDPLGPDPADASDGAPDPNDSGLDPNDSDLERDQLKGQTTLHAKPPRLEDEGQSGG